MKTVENTAIGNAMRSQSKSETITFRLTRPTLDCIDNWSATLNTNRTVAIEILLIYAIKSIAYKKQERRPSHALNRN